MTGIRCIKCLTYAGGIVFMLLHVVSPAISEEAARILLVNGRFRAETRERMDMTGRISAIEPVQGSNGVYLSSERGLFFSGDNGVTWKRSFPGAGIDEIRDLRVKDDGIFLVSGKGLFMWDPRAGSPRLIFDKKGLRGIEYIHEKGNANPVVWTDKELYVIPDPVPRFRQIEESMIEAVHVMDDVIFVVSGGYLYVSGDRGKTWVSTDVQGAYAREEEDSTEPVKEVRDVFTDVEGRVMIVTTRGIMLTDKNGKTMERESMTGPPATEISTAESTATGLLVASGGRVFINDPALDEWYVVFEDPFPEDVRILKNHIDEDGEEAVWIAAGKRLWRMECVRDKDIRPKARVVDGTFRYGVSIQDVHKMAIEYAEVGPEKIKKWRNAARWKAVLPKVSAGFSESVDENIEIYKSASTSYVVTGPREVDTDWNIGLSWDLSELVWNHEQTSIDTRSKLMVQLRNDILEEVTRLYYERKRLIREIETPGVGDPDSEDPSRRDRELRIEQLTAYIDAFTGGGFSAGDTATGISHNRK